MSDLPSRVQFGAWKDPGAVYSTFNAGLPIFITSRLLPM